MSTSCNPAFPNDLPLSCLLAFVGEVRAGLSPKVIKQALWYSGCILEKVSPADLVTVASVETYSDLDKAVDALEAALIPQVDILDDTVKTQDWTVFIPIILEVIRLIMERRAGKNTPAPKTEVDPSKSTQ